MTFGNVGKLEIPEKLGKLEGLEKLEKTESPEKLENLERLEGIEKLEGLEKLEKLGKIEGPEKPEWLNRSQAVASRIVTATPKFPTLLLSLALHPLQHRFATLRANRSSFHRRLSSSRFQSVRCHILGETTALLEA